MLEAEAGTRYGVQPFVPYGTKGCQLLKAKGFIEVGFYAIELSGRPNKSKLESNLKERIQMVKNSSLLIVRLTSLVGVLSLTLASSNQPSRAAGFTNSSRTGPLPRIRLHEGGHYLE